MPSYFSTAPQPLYAANFDYFRIPAEQWPLMLTRLRQLGLTTLILTVPWRFHQPQPDQVDLNGAAGSRRNLNGLLDLCAALNLTCLLAVGPYAENSILGQGLPAWLPAGIDAFDPQLATATENWLKTLSRSLAARQWPAGPIAALILNVLPAKPTPIRSKQITEVRWPIWLRKRYQGLAALNQAYGANYRSVSDVPLPVLTADDDSPMARDAVKFLGDLESELTAQTRQWLVEAGWEVPLFPPSQAESTLPSLSHHQTLPDEETQTAAGIINLQALIQTDLQAHDIAARPLWTPTAPIRSDGSVRRTFWSVRQRLWQHQLPGSSFTGSMLVVPLAQSGLVTGSQDETLKIKLERGSKPAIYRLQLSGQLLPASRLKAARARLSGTYLTEDEAGQTDFVFFCAGPDVPLDDFLAQYLQTLLIAQMQALRQAARQAADLGKAMGGQPDSAAENPPGGIQPKTHTLAEARRGLSQAEAALRKAMASIGELESGLGAILSKSQVDITQAAAEASLIDPALFQGQVRDELVEVGEICRQIAAQLESAADELAGQSAQSEHLTVTQYQAQYSQATISAQTAGRRLLESIAHLRTEISAKRLPLAAWRIHHRLESIAAQLRWGVLRR